MKSPFTREEQAFARSVERLAKGVEKLVELLERMEPEMISNQERLSI